MIYIDPPFWPAHGTLFSHLVSDESLAELHDFARGAGIPEGAFDQDHYDVPAHRHADLVAGGARAVDGGSLVRILIRSGLRIPARHRSSSLRLPLLLRWQPLLPAATALGERLVDCWAEPHRKYHDRRHLMSVLEALDQLTAAEPDKLGPADGTGRTLQLAAWYHDAVYRGQAGQDEEASARLALETLPAAGCSEGETVEVARLVRLTAAHDPGTSDLPGALLCDADLSVLGLPPERYARYTADVRREYASVPEPAFLAGRKSVVSGLLGRPRLFATAAGRGLWQEQAWRNLEAELRDLERRQLHGRA